MAATGIPSITFASFSLSKSSPLIFLERCYLFHFKRFPKRLALCANHAAAKGVSMSDFFANGDLSGYGERDNKWDASQYEALLTGGEQVTSVLEEMVKLLEDMNMDEASEEVAVELAAQGVIGKRVDQMETGFMMALEYMIQLAERDEDDKRKSLLEVIKETVLSHLTKKCPPHVQVIGLLCRTPQKESRHELMRRVAAGGGVFQSDNGTKVHLPGANLNDIANQADDILETMESRPVIPDRKLLARLVLIREEARNMMGGGILDERNDRGLNTLPESEVNFLTKLVALRPGSTVRGMIKSVMQGNEEGADSAQSEDEVSNKRRGIAGRASVTGRKPLPVRPGMFLETVSKVLGGIYSGNVSGITAQHLEWRHLVLGVISQIIKIQLLADLNLKKTPQLVELVDDSKDVEELMSLPPEKILLRWMNFQLKKGGYTKTVTKFSSDVKDALAYAHLLNVLAPEHSNPSTRTVKDFLERAKLVLEHADKMGCKRYLTAKDIVDGSPNLNLAFVAHIFQHRNGLSTQTKQISFLESLPEDAQISREERVFSFWLNSLANSSYTDNVFEDLRDGWILLESLDKVSPGIVNWKIASKTPIKMPFRKVENCNQVVKIRKQLKFSLVNIAGNDIVQGNKKLILAYLWQLMRCNMLQLLKNLRFHSHGKEITDADILEWANSKVRNSGSHSRMDSFKDKSLSDGIFFLELLSAVHPRSVNWSLVTKGLSEDECNLHNQHCKKTWVSDIFAT